MTTIITATPPTPNGDLHVGHLSGPYLNADIYKRYLKLRGEKTFYISSADNHQSYVVTTAKRLAREPLELAQDYAEEIRETLKQARIDIDIFSTPEAGHCQFVAAFFQKLFDAGKLVVKEKDVYFGEQTQQFFFESYLTGSCPNCFAPTSGGICETCGHPNDSDTIIDAKSSIESSENLVKKRIKVVVLELEKYRQKIRTFYENKWGKWRPHLLQLIQELLAKPLPDYPITYISDWGIPAPFPGFKGHVLNVWAEMLPGLIYSTALAERRELTPENIDSLWHQSGSARLVQFLGYDNSFFFACVHLALLMAYEGKYILPHCILTNEFYELDNFKFSTSKRHVIWAKKLFRQRHVEAVRFYLALSNPEYQKANFTLEQLDKLIEKRLIQPWSKLSDNVLKLSRLCSWNITFHPDVIEKAQIYVNNLHNVFERHYTIETFSIQRAAELLSQVICWLAEKSDTLVKESENSSPLDLLDSLAEVKYILGSLPTFLMPIMPNLAEKLALALGISIPLIWTNELTTTAPISATVVTLPTIPFHLSD